MNRLKELREERGLTQTDLAKALQIKSQSIGQYEAEKRGLSTEKLIMLSNFYGVSVDYILGLTNSRNNTEHQSNNLLHIPLLKKFLVANNLFDKENIAEYYPISSKMFALANNQNLFFIRRKETSNILLLVAQQSIANNGDIVIATENTNNNVFIKRYKVVDGQFILLEPYCSDDTSEPIILKRKSKDFRIIGKVIASCQTF